MTIETDPALKKVLEPIRIGGGLPLPEAPAGANQHRNEIVLACDQILETLPSCAQNLESTDLARVAGDYVTVAYGVIELRKRVKASDLMLTEENLLGRVASPIRDASAIVAQAGVSPSASQISDAAAQVRSALAVSSSLVRILELPEHGHEAGVVTIGKVLTSIVASGLESKQELLSSLEKCEEALGKVWAHESAVGLLRGKLTTLIDQVTGEALAGSFQVAATREESRANFWRGASAVCALLGAIGFVLGFKYLELADSTAFQRILGSAGLVVVVFLPSHYLAAESRAHRRRASWLERRALKTSALTPFSEIIEDEESRGAARKEFVQHIFSAEDDLHAAREMSGSDPEGRGWFASLLTLLLRNKDQ